MEHVCGHYCTGTRQQVGGGSREAEGAEAMVQGGVRQQGRRQWCTQGGGSRGGGNRAGGSVAAGAEAINGAGGRGGSRVGITVQGEKGNGNQREPCLPISPPSGAVGWRTV